VVATNGAASVYHDRFLTEDTVWRGEVTVEGTVTVAPQATLRIEPGTTVRFVSSASSPGLLMVQGRLFAVGGAEAPIVLTGASATAQRGAWQGVLLLGTEKKNVVEYCRIEGAATALEALYSTVALKKVSISRSATGARFHESYVTVEGGSVSDCGTAMVLRDSEVEIYRAALSRNGQGIAGNGGSLYLSESDLSGNTSTALLGQTMRLKIAGSTVNDNGSGFILSGCEGAVTASKFTGNRELALALLHSPMRISGNDIGRNPGTGLLVDDGSAVAWGNSFFENGVYDLYNAGKEEFRAPANRWAGEPKLFQNEGRGMVLTSPRLDKSGSRP